MTAVAAVLFLALGGMRSGEPGEAIGVFPGTTVDYTPAPITVYARLHLVARGGSGRFYRLDHARVE